MDFTSTDQFTDSAAGADEEQRTSRRYTSLIRAAKLISAHGEFVCVIRDVSSTGISVRSFHRMPAGDTVSLELQNGEVFDLRKVRGNEREASYTFRSHVSVERLINETWNYPKRQLRLNIAIPLTLSTLTAREEVLTINLSQQGARIECDARLAIDQTVRIEGKLMPEIRAKVRWRKDNVYGLVFDTTFTLREFAILAATLQCPILLEGIEA